MWLVQGDDMIRVLAAELSIQRSAMPLCQDVRFGLGTVAFGKTIGIGFRIVTEDPVLPGSASGNPSRSCCKTQSVAGWRVTLSAESCGVRGR
jgi:hypothetical protein